MPLETYRSAIYRMVYLHNQHSLLQNGHAGDGQRERGVRAEREVAAQHEEEDRDAGERRGGGGRGRWNWVGEKFKVKRIMV